jgi:hypothetical protein
VKYLERKAATPIEKTIDRMPTLIGRTEATTLPKASSSRIRVKGRTRASADRASRALARRRSTFKGDSPVHPSQACGCVRRSFS